MQNLIRVLVRFLIRLDVLTACTDPGCMHITRVNAELVKQQGLFERETQHEPKKSQSDHADRPSMQRSRSADGLTDLHYKHAADSDTGRETYSI